MTATLRHPGADLLEGGAAFGAYALSPGAERLRRLGQQLGDGGLARRACSVIRRLVSLGRAGPFDVEPFPGQRARLYPAENLSDKRVFAGVQFWDRAERAALGRAIRAAEPPAYVVDAGANAGLYTLAARAEARGRPVRILAIEPDPENLARLAFNLAASGAGGEVSVAPVALGAGSGETRIAADHANRGELRVGTAGTPVALRPLIEVVREAGFPRVDALKIDIEGAEAAVLAHYLDHARPAELPATVILEAPRDAETPALGLLRERGYDIAERTRMNAILLRRPPIASKTVPTHGEA